MIRVVFIGIVTCPLNERSDLRGTLESTPEYAVRLVAATSFPSSSPLSTAFMAIVILSAAKDLASE